MSLLFLELSRFFFFFISILNSEKPRGVCCVQRKLPQIRRCPAHDRFHGDTCEQVRSAEVIWAIFRLCRRPGSLFLRERTGLGVGRGGGVVSNQRWRQGRRGWSRCAACGDLRGPTAWTSRGYFWRGFVRLDTGSKSREEGRGITDTLKGPSGIPAANFGWFWHVYRLGKRLKHT